MWWNYEQTFNRVWCVCAITQCHLHSIPISSASWLIPTIRPDGIAVLSFFLFVIVIRGPKTVQVTVK